MFKKSAIIGIITVLAIIPLISASNAELWDLIILVDIENGAIHPGQAPTVTGMVVDHASNPVGQVQVHIRSGQESIFTNTDENGYFKATLSDANRVPGMYIVNIVGKTQDGKTGIATTQFQVKGDLTRTSVLEEKLSTIEARKYLESDASSFSKDPIGTMLFNHYQKLYQEFLKETETTQKLKNEQIFIEQQKVIANELREKAIEEFDPKIGTFSGYKYDDYIKSLNPEIRDTIINQLNFTKNLFADAHLAREQVLANGGSEEEARQAFIEKITITKEALDNFEKDTPETTENATSAEQVEITTEETQPEDQNETSQVDAGESDIKISVDGKKIFININGTNIEFFVNSTGIYQVD
ncbi:MAG: Ig-like domain-containing protein [Nitrosarchaeum sp.]|nr:Ig-like domain-containing protein [Nitrosarchaeum sp.]MCV0399071.1 Ig-like domain-containing protein [Nitrosarchaeum sp.]